MERRDLVMINKKRRKKKRVCQFCADKNTKIDYKNYQKLEKFVTERGKILPRRITGTCAKHQRELTKNDDDYRDPRDGLRLINF